MSWTCHGTTNAGMVAALKRAGLVRTAAIEEALLAVDRGLFVPPGQAAYQDCPQPLGYGATISAPHMHAACLELLAGQLRPGNRVLDVGSGSGYLTLVMAHLVAQQGAAETTGEDEEEREEDEEQQPQGGRVVGVEHIGELVQGSVAAAERVPWAADMMRRGELRLLQGDGYAGYPEAGWAPFDAIHVGAAAPELPSALVAQLAPGGRLVVPVGPEGGPQHLVVVDREAGEGGAVVARREMGVLYVPLTTETAQRGKAGAGARRGGGGRGPGAGEGLEEFAGPGLL